jgi:DNA-binding GntR family transcriptional regulator
MAERAAVIRSAAPLRQQVVELLREAIVDGEFRPGERLLEGPLCDRFGVSRTVVREALRQLESEGLVAMVPNRGPIVAELTVSDAQALYEIRSALEGLAGARFTALADDAQRTRLKEALARVREAYRTDDLRARLAAKDVFYDALFDGARNEMIRSILRGIHARVRLLRGLSLQAPGRSEISLRELEDLTRAAIEKRDPDETRKLCEAHVMSAAAVALHELSQRGDD